MTRTPVRFRTWARHASNVSNWNPPQDGAGQPESATLPGYRKAERGHTVTTLRMWGTATTVAALLLSTTNLFLSPLPAQYSRRTPIVEAVEKTSGSILTLKVEKRDAAGRYTESVGTAVIVDERGYAVTNRHVITGASYVDGYLPNGTRFAANIVVEDSRRDLAILKLEGKQKLKALPLGPSSDLMVGETVMAIGNPFGYSHTVSRGIISALGRQITLPSGDKLGGLIQIDAPINPGSSGGPLININGELIGINVAMRDGAVGIAFAIPSDAVKEWLAQHLSARKMSGWDHGLACTEWVEPEGRIRQRVIVKRIDDKGFAAGAGLRAGDEIVQIAGRDVTNRFDVERALWETKSGDKVAFVVFRAGQKVELATAIPAPSKNPQIASGQSGQ